MNPDVENYDTTEIEIEHLNEWYAYNVPRELSVSGIHRAVLEGDLCKVKRWIESGGSVNEREISIGFSALHLAVIKNDTKILEYLLTRDDIQVDCACSTVRTALYLATILGHLELVQKLIQAGSNINFPNKNYQLPLHKSVNHPDICQLLIRHGAPIDAVDRDGRIPLHYAAECGCVEAVHMLLYYNADANAEDTSFSTPFMIAVDCGKVSAQKVLLEYADDFDRIYGSYRDCASILIRALQMNSPLVKDIIERGADVNYFNPELLNVNAFLACLDAPVDASTFKFVWERLNYETGIVDLLRLLRYPKAVPSFLEVIIEGDNFELAVEFFSEKSKYHSFVFDFIQGKFDLDQLTALTCRLLQYGYRPTNYDVHAIFSNYGDCELFRILLYMDIDYTERWAPYMTLTRLILDVHYKLEGLKVEDLCCIPNKRMLPSLNKFFIQFLPLFEYYSWPHLHDALTHRCFYDEKVIAILNRVPRVPSLIELARNSARVHIWQSFNVTNTCQFYTTIDHLAIPTLYRDILTFKRKMYKVK